LDFIINSKLQMQQQHPRVVQFYGAIVSQEDVALVLEFMPGGSLSQLNLDLSWQFDWKRILEQIAQGMHYIHSLKVVHRDLNTKNILVWRLLCLP
jgi:serine/threonine protein kinase